MLLGEPTILEELYLLGEFLSTEELRNSSVYSNSSLLANYYS